MRPSRLAPHRRSPLRTGRDHRRAHVALDRRRSRFEQPMLSIHDRLASATDRIEAGHWEGDLVRHEALCNRAEVKDLRRCAVAAA